MKNIYAKINAIKLREHEVKLTILGDYYQSYFDISKNYSTGALALKEIIPVLDKAYKSLNKAEAIGIQSRKIDKEVLVKFKELGIDLPKDYYDSKKDLEDTIKNTDYIMELYVQLSKLAFKVQSIN
jgi:hypothetical protein